MEELGVKELISGRTKEKAREEAKQRLLENKDGGILLASDIFSFL